MPSNLKPYNTKKIILRFLLLFTLVFTFSMPVIAQQNINTQTFFELGLAKLEAAQSQLENSQTTKPLRFPWIEEYEFRTETRDFDFGSQEYTFRVTPSSSKRRKLLKDTHQYLNSKPDFEQRDFYCNAVAELYSDWLALYVLDWQLQELEYLQQILEDKQQVYDKMLGTLEVDLQKLVRLQTDKSDLKVLLYELQLEQNSLFQKYELEEGILDFGDFIQVESLVDVLKGSDGTDVILADAEEWTYEKGALEKEWQLEEAERKELLDFLQVRYRGPHEDVITEKLAVGLALKLPNSHNQKLKMRELQLEIEELERERQYQEKEQKQETSENIAGLLLELDAYQFYEKTVNQERQELQKLGKLIAQQQGFNPLLLLDIEERHIETQLKSLRKREGIFYDFLEYLEESGKMCVEGNEQFTNHLLR